VGHAVRPTLGEIADLGSVHPIKGRRRARQSIRSKLVERLARQRLEFPPEARISGAVLELLAQTRAGKPGHAAFVRQDVGDRLAVHVWPC